MIVIIKLALWASSWDNRRNVENIKWSLVSSGTVCVEVLNLRVESYTSKRRSHFIPKLTSSGKVVFFNIQTYKLMSKVGYLRGVTYVTIFWSPCLCEAFHPGFPAKLSKLHIAYFESCCEVKSSNDWRRMPIL